MPRKKQIEIRPAYGTNLLKLGDEYYIKKREYFKKDGHISKIVYEEIDKDKYKKRVEKLTKKILEKGVPDKEIILHQALVELPLSEIKKIEDGIKKKKPKTKLGCLLIDVGGVEIPIIDNSEIC